MMKRTGMKLALMAMLVVGISAASCVLTPTGGSEDSTPPTISITSPTNNQVVETNFTVSGTMQDAETGIQAVYMSVDGASFGAVPNTGYNAKSQATWSTSVSHAAESNVVISVFAKDLKGNVSITNSVEVDIVGIDIPDTEAPVFSTAPAIANITTNSFDITATIGEAGTVYYAVYSNGVTAPTVAEVMAGTGAIASDDSAATASTQVLFDDVTFVGIMSSTAYDVYVVAADDEATPNVQTNVTLLEVTTLMHLGTVTELRAEFAGLTNLQIKDVNIYIDVYVSWVENEFVYMQANTDGGPGIGAFDTGLEDTVERGDRIIVQVTNIQQYYDMETIYYCALISNVSSGNTITAVDVLATRNLIVSDEAVWVELDGMVEAKDDSTYAGLNLITISNGNYRGTLNTAGTIFASANVGDWITAYGPVWVYDESMAIVYADQASNTFVTVTPDPGPMIEMIYPTNGSLVISSFSNTGWVLDSRTPIDRIEIKVDTGSWQSGTLLPYTKTAGETNYWTNNISGLLYGTHDLYARARNIYLNYGNISSNRVIVPGIENDGGNDVYTGADSLVFDAPRYAAVDTAGDNDWYAINLTSGIEYTVTTYQRPGSGLTVDTRIWVYSDPLSSADFSTNATGAYEFLDFTADSTATWYIRIDDSGATGDYAVKIEEK